jgi:hypothetical protein
MKVVNLELFRAKKEVELLEQKINEISNARELKVCYKEWIQKKTGTTNQNK